MVRGIIDLYVKRCRLIKIFNFQDIRDKIELLKEVEVDLDDEDLVYIMEEKYQKKFVKVWNKLCEIKESSVDIGRFSQRKFRYSGRQYIIYKVQ